MRVRPDEARNTWPASGSVGLGAVRGRPALVDGGSGGSSGGTGRVRLCSGRILSFGVSSGARDFSGEMSASRSGDRGAGSRIGDGSGEGVVRSGPAGLKPAAGTTSSAGAGAGSD